MAKKVLEKKDILHLALLSKLILTDEEIVKYLNQLEETVGYIENLNQLNTGSVVPTSNVTGLTNVYFEDGVQNERSLGESTEIGNIDHTKNRHFVVGRIM